MKKNWGKLIDEASVVRGEQEFPTAGYKGYFHLVSCSRPKDGYPVRCPFDRLFPPLVEGTSVRNSRAPEEAEKASGEMNVSGILWRICSSLYLLVAFAGMVSPTGDAANSALASETKSLK